MKEHAHRESWLKEVPAKNGYGLLSPAYTHWTISYALTFEGAKKLISQEPLKKLVPVDEYLPIMFDRQPK
jgi:collagen beta-1,O-galactosyltransferase